VIIIIVVVAVAVVIVIIHNNETIDNCNTFFHPAEISQSHQRHKK
jgi:cytochrome c-type biogenesis protein CcmE